LQEDKLQQAGNQACCKTSEQRAGNNSVKHLVAGKAGRVTHIMRTAVDCRCLQVTCKNHHGQTN